MFKKTDLYNNIIAEKQSLEKKQNTKLDKLKVEIKYDIIKLIKKRLLNKNTDIFVISYDIADILYKYKYKNYSIELDFEISKYIRKEIINIFDDAISINIINISLGYFLITGRIKKYKNKFINGTWNLISNLIVIFR